MTAEEEVIWCDTCPYCGAEARISDAQIVYGIGTNYGKVLLCSNWPECDAYVSVHRYGWKGGEPMGTMANAELRGERRKLHELFDPLWNKPDDDGKMRMSRVDAYIWLSYKMDLPMKECHIAMFDLDKCREATKIIKKEWKDIKPLF